MIVDRDYCMSSFLIYRTIHDEKVFSEKYPHVDLNSVIPKDRTLIHNSEELYTALKRQVEEATKDGKSALALSGGIDSAILARFMPKGSVAYTFKCVVPGIEVTDESPMAAKYARECGLEHRVIEIYWEDFEKYAPILMKYKGAPIHSIEVQIYKAALQAKVDGFKRFIFGESADCVFGGHSNLLSKEWRIGDFIERYSFVPAYKVLKKTVNVFEPFCRHEKNGFIDPHEFLSTEFYPESVGSYVNAMKAANFELIVPYANCKMACPIDYSRIRNGENKYLIREVFHRLYERFDIPVKTPMPRPTNEWFKDWAGPTRPEFYPHCTDNMTGDQKWLVWVLEKFLDMIDSE